MRTTPHSPIRVVVVGNGSVAFGVGGLLLQAGYDPAFVAPVLYPKPATDMHKRSRVERISRPGWNKDSASYGSLQDAFEVLSDADWILEASGGSVQEKQALFRYIEVARKPTCLVTSDESVATVSQLAQGLGQRFARSFGVTHFFLPVERLPLVELVFGDIVLADTRDFIARICTEDLGRRVLYCPDRPGFVANRIGMYWAAMAAMEAVRLKLSVEDADVAVRDEFEVPRSGVFGLIDLVGIDVFVEIVRSMQASLPASDDIQKYRLQENLLIETLLACKRTGRASGAGFYQYDAQGKPARRLDLEWNVYKPLADQAGQLMMNASDAAERSQRLADFKQILRSKLEAYVRGLCAMDDVTHEQVNTAMQLGFGWKSKIGPPPEAEQILMAAWPF